MTNILMSSWEDEHPDTRFLLDMKLGKIVSLKIGDKKIKIYKNILTSSSPVFAAMFEHDTKESKTNIIKITDMDENICKQMVMFLNTGELQYDITYLTYDVLVGLLKAADKYYLERLKALCERYLYLQLNINNSVDVFIQACLYNAHQLKELTLNFIQNNIDQVMETDGYEIIKKYYPQHCFEIFENIHKKNKMKKQKTT